MRETKLQMIEAATVALTFRSDVMAATITYKGRSYVLNPDADGSVSV